jgi:hypothetical protein
MCPLIKQIFSMIGIDWKQWLIVIGFAVAVFIVMEVEKCLRNYLTFLKYDTDDKEFDEVFDTVPEPTAHKLPAEADRFGKGEASH